MPSPDPLLDALLTAAATHGRESDPDHEVGDLQDILRTAWAHLTPVQRRAVFAQHEDLVTDWPA